MLLTDRKSRIPYLLSAFLGLILLITEPAHANAPMLWGLDNAMAPVRLAGFTRGWSIIAVLIIESWILYRFLDYSWIKIILIVLAMNLISAIFGIFISPFIFSASFFLIIALIALPLVNNRVLKSFGAPRWIVYVSNITFITGSIFAGITSTTQYINNPIQLLLLIEAPLLYGFGVTLAIEGLIAAVSLKHKNIWKAVLWANVCSYMILIFFYPWFAGNPVTHSMFLDKHVKDMIKHGETDKVIEILHQRRQSAQYLLGLTSENPVPEIYNADFELELLTRYSPVASITAIALVEDTLEQPTLTDEATTKLVWLRDFYTFWLDAEDAITKGEQSELDAIYVQWSEWGLGNEYPDPDVVNRSGFRSWNTDPGEIIFNLIESHGNLVDMPKQP